MDELKKLIEENRQMFDSAEPSENHFDKFQQMLMASTATKSRKIVWTTLLKIASIAILITLSGLYVAEHFVVKKLTSTTYKNTEFNEAQQYYIQLVDQRIGSIEEMKDLMSDEQKEILVKELSEMDVMFKKLQNDAKALPNDPRIIQAMLQHYQMKMDILNRIVNDLKNVQHLNSINHENTEL